MGGVSKFFLGIGGQQSGPFTEDEIKAKITSREAPGDSLVWFEGLADWQRLDSLAFFKDAFEAKSSHPEPEPPAAPLVEAPTTRPAPKEEFLRPVFSPKEAVFFRPKGPRPELVVGAVVALLLGGGLFWYLGSQEENTKIDPLAQVPKNDPKSRPGRLKKAESDFLLNPSTLPADFLALVQENPNDESGKRALALLESTYTKRKNFRELGSLYQAAGRPWDAVGPFTEGKFFNEAEQAALQAFEKSSDVATRKSNLIKAIQLLTGPLHNTAEAVQKIQAFEKAFPQEPHPFSYYMLPTDKKIADLFGRTSYFFVEHLLQHVKAEFPELKLAARPMVAIAKQGQDRYQIVGSNQGEVLLNHDRLKDIRFEYWLVGNEWMLVGTNVTAERKAWARKAREHLKDPSVTSAQMLNYLESVIHNQFPQLGIHEKINPELLATAAREKPSDKK